MGTVKEEEVVGALTWIRNLRLWAVQKGVDPWAVREALIIALEMDTEAALIRGISMKDLERFDALVREDAKIYARGLKGPRRS